MTMSMVTIVKNISVAPRLWWLCTTEFYTVVCITNFVRTVANEVIATIAIL